MSASNTYKGMHHSVKQGKNLRTDAKPNAEATRYLAARKAHHAAHPHPKFGPQTPPGSMKLDHRR